MIEPRQGTTPARRHRARTVAIGGGLVLAAAIGLAVATGALGGTTSGPDPTAAPESREPETPTADPTPSDEPAEPTTARPLVVVTQSGVLELLDPTSGAVLRVVRDDLYTEPDDPRAVSVSADGTTAFLDRRTGGDAGEIVRVSLTDGTADVVAEGSNPSISPDGRTVASVSVAADLPDVPFTLILTDLATGDARALNDTWPSATERLVSGASWSTDASTVFLEVGWFDAPARTSVVSVELATAASLDDATPLSPEPDPQDPAALTSWSWPRPTADGGVAVAASRSELDLTTGEEVLRQSWIVVLDTTSGAERRRLAAPTGWVTALALEPDGEGLAVLTAEPDGNDGFRRTLHLSDGTGPFVPLVEEIAAVDW